MEEDLREAACVGDIQNVEILLKNGTFVNSRHSMNGWTPLHWAAKRGHSQVVKRLLRAGADPSIRNCDGKMPIQITTKPNIKLLLNGDMDNHETVGNSEATSFKANQSNNESLAVNFTPSYLSNPVFPHRTPKSDSLSNEPSNHRPVYPEQNNFQPSKNHDNINSTNISGKDGFLFQPSTIMLSRGNLEHCPVGLLIHPDELVLKCRVFDESSENQDFVEVSFNRKTKVTIDMFKDVLYKNLSIDKSKHSIQTIRKLPNTILNKDSDILRLTDYQEIEVVKQKLSRRKSTS